MVYRLTQEVENILRIDWSPNGNKILYTTTLKGGSLYSVTNIRIADSESKVTQNPSVIYGGISWGGNGWITDDKFVYSIYGDGGPQGHHISYLDVVTLKEQLIWLYSTESINVDNNNQKLIISTSPFGVREWQPEPEEGVYFVNLDGSYSKISGELFHFQKDQDFINSYFGSNKDNQIINIQFNGQVTKISQMGIPRTSPNGKFTLVTDNEKVSLYSETLQLIKSWELNLFGSILWQPDSKAVFIYSNNGLYHLTIPNGEPELVDTCLLPKIICSQLIYKWIS
jgi:hypothetical protein